MTRVDETKAERIARRQVDKFAERRAQLANSTLRTLAELGYARTSLREIAQNSEFSHGVLHYYFKDKVDLITYCVRQYKAECVTRYDAMVHEAGSAGQLRLGFGQALADTLRSEVDMHRLWYDLRNQSLFEESFHADVRDIDKSIELMIWRVVSQFAELSDTALTVDCPTAYGIFDGLFQQAMFHHLTGDPEALDRLQEQVPVVLDTMLKRD